MRADLGGDDLDRDRRAARHLAEMGQLVAHDLGRADPPVQDRLIQHRQQLGRIGPVQDGLPLDPGTDQGIQVIATRRRLPGLEQRPRVVTGLQQARDQDRLPGPQRRGLLLGVHPFRNHSGYRPFARRASSVSRENSPSRCGNASSIAAATSGDGGRSPVSALVITVRSNPSERLNWSWLMPAAARARRSSAPRNAAGLLPGSRSRAMIHTPVVA
jgi:hypothetical protein